MYAAMRLGLVSDKSRYVFRHTAKDTGYSSFPWMERHGVFSFGTITDVFAVYSL